MRTWFVNGTASLGARNVEIEENHEGIVGMQRCCRSAESFVLFECERCRGGSIELFTTLALRHVPCSRHQHPSNNSSTAGRKTA